jgi:hypothetical protein
MKDGKEMAATEQTPSPQQTQTTDALQFCDHLMRDFQARADRHKRIFKFLRYASVLLAVVVTALATLTATQKEYLWVVPLISGLSALCTTLLSTTNSQERWVHSRGVQQALEAESFLYLQKAGPYAALDEEGKLRCFVERIVEIWSNAQQEWAQSITKIAREMPKT